MAARQWPGIGICKGSPAGSSYSTAFGEALGLNSIRRTSLPWQSKLCERQGKAVKNATPERPHWLCETDRTSKSRGISARWSMAESAPAAQEKGVGIGWCVS